MALGSAVVLVAGWALFQRFALKNFHAVVEGQVYRSARPSPGELRRWKEKYGLRSVITLQGYSGTRAVVEEGEAAKALGVRHVSSYMSSDRLPAPAEAVALVRLLETEPRPVLVHCRSGVDRTGFASVVAAMMVGGLDYEAALSQLSPRYLFVPRPGPNVNDIFGLYEAHCRRTGAPRGGWKEFRPWLEGVYKPSCYHVLIEVPAALAARPGETLTLQVRITNSSNEVLPLADPGRHFDLIAFAGRASGRWTDDLWGRAALQRQDVPPGGSMAVSLEFRAPLEPGTTALHFDLEERGADRFGIYGSPIPSCSVTVK